MSIPHGQRTCDLKISEPSDTEKMHTSNLQRSFHRSAVLGPVSAPGYVVLDKQFHGSMQTQQNLDDAYY